MEARMRKVGWVVAFAAASWACALGWADAPTGQERAVAAGQGLIGTPAPPLTLTTIDGKTLDLGSLYGHKAVYLKFWATWCVPCRQQMPHFEHTFETAGPDLAVIAVNAGFNDTLEDVRAYQKTMGLQMPIVIDDGRLGAALNLRVTPQHVVIGRDGRILYIGHVVDDRLEQALRVARTSGGRGPVTRKPARPYWLAEHHYNMGDRAPDLGVRTLAGETFRLREAQAARPTVLAFLSPWCESYLATSRPQMAANCRAVRERIDAVAAAHQARLLGIASGLWATREELVSYRDEHRTAIPLTLDESGELFRAFSVTSVPTVLVLDTKGCIVRRMEGADTKGLDELPTMTSTTDCVQK
jgi:peroxiredoxin